MGDLNRIRAAFPDLDKYNYSDSEVINWMAGRLGQDPQELGVEYGVIDPDQGDLSRGFQAGVDSTKALVSGAVGIAGDTLGFEGMRDAGIRGYQRNMADIGLNSRPTDNAENVDSLGDAADFAQYYLGYAAPQIAEAALSGGIGSILGKQVVKQGVRRQVGSEVAERALRRETGQNLLETAGRRGGLAAMGTQAVGTETGAIYGDAAQRAIDEGRSLDSVDTGRVALGGLAAGALEFGADVATLGLARVGPAKGALDLLNTRSRTANAAIRGTTGAVAEGTTEVLQTGIEEVGAGTPLAEANFSDPTAFFAGAVGGGAIAGAGGLISPTPSGSDINTQEAQLRAEEDAQLEAQALAEEKTAAVQAQAEAESTARIRREAAATFTPRAEFVASQQKLMNDQLQADIRNPQTELGNAFEANLNEKGVFDPADVEAEAKAFLKGYQKETKAETDARINEEYIAALDRHAEAVARGELPITQAVEGDTATDAAPQENVAAPAKKPTKKEQLRADAVEKLGEDFEQNYPELSQLLSDGKGIYSRGKNKKSRFESMLDKAVAEQAAEAQPDATQAQQPPVEAEQTATPAAQEDTAATPVIAKEETAAETLSSMDARAEAYAKEKLGDNWRETNPALVELLNGKKYAGFQTNVDRVAAEAPAVADAQAETTVAEPEVAPTTTEPTTDIAAVFTQALPSDVKLSPNEQKVFDTMQQAFANNEQDDIIQSDGKLNPQRIADRGGMNSRQAAQTALTRLRPKLAKAYGISQEQIKQRLAETKNKSTEAFDPNEAAAEVDLAELGNSMGTVASANQGARDGMSPEDRDFIDNMEDTPITPQERAELDAKRAEFDAEIKAHPMYKDVRGNWDGFFEVDIENEADRVPFDTLDAGTRFDFFTSFLKYQSGDIDIDALGSEYDFLRRDYLKDVENEKTQAALERGQPQSEKSAKGLEPNRGEVREAGVDGEQTPPTTAEFQERAANVQVETKKRKKIDPKKAKMSNPRFGVRDNATATASREVFEQSVNELTGDTQNVRIHVFDNEADALAAVENGDVPSADVDEIAKVQPYGWVQEDENGVPHAHFILDRIPAGGERAAFMHEVGGHVGIDNVLDEASRTKLASQIADWAGANDGSLESKLALRTLRRMDLAAMRGGVSDGVVVSEAIAYFLEEATLAGVDPTAGDAIGNFVQRIYDAFKAAFEALGLRNTDTLVAQDIVDMAYGAARFELMEGSPDPTTTTAPFQRPSYGVNRNQETRTEATRAYVKENLGGAAVKFLDDASFIARNAVDSTKFLHQFIRENKETMPSAGRWYNGMLEAEKTRNDIRRSVESIATQARDLNADRLDVVNDFIGSSTFYQKWGYDPEVEGKTVKVDPIMKRRFGKLAPKEQQLVKDIFAHGETMRQRKQEIAKKLGVQGKFFSDAALEGPYAPLKRFGNFVGQLKSQELLDAEAELRENRSAETRKRVDDLKSNEDHYVISFFDTMGAAKQFADANREKFTFAVASERSPDMESDRVASPEVFDKILGQLRADDNSGIDASAKTAFAEMVKKMYFQSLDERSARQSGARRMNRAGYEKNMLRSFLSHARAEAALVANMEHGAEINTAFAEANVEASQDEANLRSVYNMVAKHYRDTLVGKETPIQDRLAAMNSVYMLTTSVGYHVTNATQPMMVTIPRLAGDFKNYSGAWGALTRGYKVSVKAAKLGKNLEADIDVSKAPPKYRKLLEDLQLRQLLDVGMEEDLSAFDRFNTGYEPLNRLGDKLGTVVHKLYQVARFVEAHNRISAAVAAYDMALANPEVPKRLKMTPEEYATAVVEDTQGNFARFDSPYVIKALPKMTTQYRKYQLMMGWAYGNAFNQAFMDKNISPEEKAMGKRVLGYTLSHAGIFAGVTGVPLVTTLAPYVLGWIEGEDEPQDLERWIRDNVDNERLADVLSRGVFSSVGVDMSTKLSQGKIFHPFPYVDFEASEDGVRDIFFNALAGPSGTTALNFGRAAEYAGQGDLMKATEYAVPKGLRTMIESYRLGTEGFSAKNGDVLVDPRGFDMQSLLLNALGIPSTDVQKFKWTRGQQFELSQYVSNESSRIRREYIQANDAGDRARMTELRGEWRDLQDQKERIRPFFGNGREMRRQPLSDLIKAPRSQDRRERRAQQRFE